VRCAELDPPTVEIEETAPTSFMEYIKGQDQITQRLLHWFEFVPGGERTLKECLQNNKKIQVVSDGSLDLELKLASFGWLGKCLGAWIWSC